MIFLFKIYKLSKCISSNKGFLSMQTTVGPLTRKETCEANVAIKETKETFIIYGERG